MCGRFSLTTNIGAAALRFGVRTGLEETGNVPRYNIAPTQTVVVVGDDGQRYLTQMRWGLIPSWAIDSAIGNRMINARAEMVATRPAFRLFFTTFRGVFADGMYQEAKRNANQSPQILRRIVPTVAANAPMRKSFCAQRKPSYRLMAAVNSRRGNLTAGSTATNNSAT